jgi:DNA polymerase-3 subunit epsilon
MDWTPCGRESATFWTRLLGCRSDEPDSSFPAALTDMREIVLDTETTGLDPLRGDRLVEIGCVEILNRMPTGQTFHRHLNPERDMPAEAFAVHGLSSQFLADKPLFAHVVEEFLQFIADAPLVIHNASFDVGFINAELERIKRPTIARERLVDTLLLARRKHPGVSNRLDDLCSRYAIDNSRRTKHGALLDAELLAEVYIDLIGARQSQLILATEARDIRVGVSGEMPRRQREVPLPPRLTDADRAAHRDFVATLGDKAIWNDFLNA